MLEVYKQIAHAADSAVPVLITGESGTGKELVARAIHENSRRGGPAVRGRQLRRDRRDAAGVGAVRPRARRVHGRRGRHEGPVRAGARRHDLPRRDRRDVAGAAGQAAARPRRRARSVRSAATGPVRVDVRVIAATNRDLEQAVAEQRFRTDLYYRLNVIVIRVPPLRERRDDIPLLAANFLRRRLRADGRRVELITAALGALAAYDWPGNVRELENTVERLVLFSRGTVVDAADLPSAFHGAPQGDRRPAVRGAPVARGAGAPLPAARSRERRRQPDPRCGSHGHRQAHAVPHGGEIWDRPQGRVGHL